MPAGTVLRDFLVENGALGCTIGWNKTIQYLIGTVENADGDLTDSTDVDLDFVYLLVQTLYRHFPSSTIYVGPRCRATLMKKETVPSCNMEAMRLFMTSKMRR